MKNEAVSLGLCAQWTAEWHDNSSKHEMVEKFVKGIDFCIGKNWPSTKDMKKYFGDVIHDHGVYVNEKTCNCLRGQLVLPSTPVISGYGSYCCNSTAPSTPTTGA